MSKEPRSLKMERRINYARFQASQYDELLKSVEVRRWPDFAKEPYRKKRRELLDEVRRLEGRQEFFKKMREEQKKVGG